MKSQVAKSYILWKKKKKKFFALLVSAHLLHSVLKINHFLIKLRNMECNAVFTSCKCLTCYIKVCWFLWQLFYAICHFSKIVCRIFFLIQGFLHNRIQYRWKKIKDASLIWQAHSAYGKLIFFLFFTFSLRDSLHGMSHINFWEKIRKNISEYHQLNFLPACFAK